MDTSATGPDHEPDTQPDTEPDAQPDTEPFASLGTHPDLPLEVLEDDEDVPPRPEESVADAPDGV